MGDFRPIALANFQFKIVTKNLAERLIAIRMRIISPQQCGFVRDRNISDYVIIASEVINMLPKKRFGGNAAVKVDIRKAFDTMDWNFLLLVLSSFGFHTVFCNWIRTILHSACLSILVNGSIVGFFPCKRGVRQGDPLSPLLFCLAEEVLSNAIELKRAFGALQPMPYCRNMFLPTHVLYADDIFICCTGTHKNIKCLMQVFTAYSEVSDQLVNFEKSKLFTGAMIPSISRNLARLSGFSLGAIPFNYLGCPIFQGRPRRAHFQEIVDRINVKLASWKGSLLTIMGRVQLVKSIIHGMLVYSFHIYRWPQNLLKMLDRWIKKIIWSGDIFTRKICTFKWSIVSLPWDSGGLNLKPTTLIINSLMLHLSWKMYSQDSQCASLLKHRYFCNGTIRRHYIKSSVWHGLKLHMDTVVDNSIWMIGNGDKINLWLDNWLGASLASIMNIDPNKFSSLTSKLSSVIDDGRWRLPPMLISNDMVAASISLITLMLTPLLDVMVWSHTTDGGLTANQAFHYMRGPSQSVAWAASIWRNGIPPSHSIILWRLAHLKLPMDENLQSRGCTLVSICVLCYKSAETSFHLFFECEYAAALWNWIGSLLNCTFQVQSVAEILNCIPAACSPQARDVFISDIVHVTHAIWLARNAIWFDGRRLPLHTVKNNILKSVSLSGSLSEGNCIPSDITLLENFHAPPSFRKFKDIISVVWKPPTVGWVKVNTNGSVINSSASCGGIFRDHRGTFMGCFASNLGAISVFEAELQGIIIALENAARFNWKNIWVESDSSSAVLAFKNSDLIPFRLRNHWHNCQLGITVVCSHIYREGNCCADRLGALGHGVFGLAWFDRLPPSLLLDFSRDRNGLPNYRFL